MEAKNIINIKFMFMILFIMVFAFGDRIAYAQIEINQEQQVEEINNSNKNSDEPKILEYFTVENNTYKVLNPDKDDNIVMFWKCKKLDDLKRTIVNNQVQYNGRNFKVKYVYEEAFYNIKTSKNIIIDDDVIGFCDLSGHLIETLNETFIEQEKLESVDFGSTKFIFGEGCFQNCKSIVDIEIPKNMSVMEGYCFNKCSSLKSVDLSGIREFKGQSNLANCSKLENIGKFNNEVIKLPDKTFAGCSNLRITNLNNVTKLGNGCFESCKLLNKDIVTDIEEIGDKCFSNCSFSEVYLKKAKRVGLNAFSNCGALKKIRFGNSTIPILENYISYKSAVNEWVYPLSYKTQSNYLDFLSKLSASKVIWYSNYENKDIDTVITYGDKLNELKSPEDIVREEYEIEGWYKEQECINKVNMIADLGEISGSDLVIKDPKLYAKWIAKDNLGEETNSNNPEEEVNPNESEDTNDAEEEVDPNESEDANNPEEEVNPSKSEDTNDPEEEVNPSESEDTSEPEEEVDSNESEEVANPSDSEEIHNSENIGNIAITKSKKTKKNNNEIPINEFKWEFQDRTNNNIQILTVIYLSKLLKIMSVLYYI